MTRRTVLGLGLLSAAVAVTLVLLRRESLDGVTLTADVLRVEGPGSDLPLLAAAGATHPAAGPAARVDDAPAGPHVPLEIPAEDRLEVTVLSAITEEPLPGLRLGWERESSPASMPAVEADARGRVVVPAPKVRELYAVGDDWRMLDPQEIAATGRLYLVPLRRVHITAKAAKAAGASPDLTSVEVTLGFDRTWLDDALQVNRREPNERRDRAHILFSQLSAVRGRADAAGELTLVSLRGLPLVVWGTAPGWRSDPVELARDIRPGDADVRLELRPVPLLRLRVVDASGRPLPQAVVRVAACVPVEGQVRTLTIRAVRGRELEAPLPALVVQRGGGQAAVYRRTFDADLEGRIHIDCDAGQSLTLVTQDMGMLSDVRTVRSGAEVEEEIVLLDAACSGPRLPVRQLGKPLRRGTLTRRDITEPGFPIECPVKVDVQGTVPAREFREGRSYELSSPDGPPLYVRWDGRDTLDLDILESSWSRFHEGAR